MLDFSQIVGQIAAFSDDRARSLPVLEAALREAARRLRDGSDGWEATRDKIARSKTTWLVAGWREMPDGVFPAPPRPLPHVVLASDGSQIVADKDDIALCYLLNIGLIALRYGDDAKAFLDSRPTLAVAEDELLEEYSGEQEAINGKRLALRRQMAELEGLTDLIAAHAGGMPALALTDGSLILWPLESEKPEFRDRILAGLECSLNAARSAGVPLAGYISNPQSRDVINALRVSVCEYEHAHCERNCPGQTRPRPLYEAPPCAGTERVRDADLFDRLLEPGQRSAVFASNSQILLYYPEDHRICFFYFHTGREIARIEIPQWVVENPALLDLTHALAWDQAQKGDGYAVALAEAHEQAVVRAPEKEMFFRLMERRFVATHQTVCNTQKVLSKRARRV